MTYFPFLQRIPVSVAKREFCKFFPKTTLFHINRFYIVNVSIMHDFLSGFNSPESVLADQNDLFKVFATENCNLKKRDEVTRA